MSLANLRLNQPHFSFAPRNISRLFPDGMLDWAKVNQAGSTPRLFPEGGIPMSAEENVTIARRFFAEQDRRKGPLADELCAPGYTAYVAGFPPMDLAGHSEFAKAFYGAF